MKLEKLSLSLTAIGVGLVFASFSCNDNEFGGKGADGNKSTEKRDDKTSENSEDLGSEDDEEQTAADISVQVSGAYLTCQTDTELPNNSDDHVGVGCSIFENDGRRFNLTGYSKIFSVVDATGADTGTVFNLDGDKYDTTTSIPLNSVDLVSARAVIAKEGVSETLTSKITSSDIIFEVPESSKPIETTFGSDSDFHIGDGNFAASANADCTVKPQRAAAVGKKIIIKLEVKSEAAIVSVSLGEMCGIDRDANYVIFTGKTLFPPQKSIKKGANEFVFSGTRLKQGFYSFEVRSGTTGGDNDDFVVGKIGFVAEGEVVFEEPVAGK